MDSGVSIMLIHNEEDYSFLAQGITYISFSSSIYSMYPVGMLKISLDESLIEKGIFSIGKAWRIGISKVSTKETKFFDFCIWKIQAVSKNILNNTMTREYLFQLVHPFFFEQKNISMAYKGTPDIVVHAALLKNNLLSFFDSFAISSSITGNKKYFQLKENFGSFLEKKVLPNYIIDGSPVYCFVDFNNSFIIKSYKECLNNPTKALAGNPFKNVAFSTEQIDLAMSKHLFTAIYDLSYSLNDSGTLWHRLKAKSTALQVFNQSMTPRTLNKKETSVIENVKNSYPLYYNPQKITKNDYLFTYLDDSGRGLDSAFASFSDKHKYVIDDQKVIISGSMAFNIQVGLPLTIDIPENFSLEIPNDSSFSTTYVVSSVLYTYAGGEMLCTYEAVKDGLPSSSFGHSFK